MKRVPRPQVGDLVETLDLRKTLGVVMALLDNEKVLVEWSNKPQIERISKLALISRDNQIIKV